MSQSTYSTAPIEIGAGAAFKAGFFGALGVFCFGLILSVLLGIISLIIGIVFGSSLIGLINQR